MTGRLSKGQDSDYKWFCRNYARLSAANPRKYLVISNRRVLATADSYAAGVAAGDRAAGRGNFICQYCNGTANLLVEEMVGPIQTIDIDALQAQLEKTWKGTDCNEFMNTVRGREPGEGDGRG